ncbi:YfdQ family protein [Actinobacillus equuli subsp. equuli]|uniref:YfdQ family protein n=1 Tax=Actinobacillus equuli subsp. equuli TaxID=202947 RepID=A0A9X4G558_ACTEU|nr:DUF2303 family protein [Actinobacillus equuli]MDE8035313.1 YfdQ family protein [Actinobacillus equuli subsp. equuli]MDG4948390.1 YfdQ family protein [Actinobacillus equuli subsp. haemolyticus]
MEKIIKEIASLASNGLNVGELAGTPAILTRDDFEIKSLEHLQPTPNRIRQAVTVSTSQSLIDYTNKFKIAGTAIFCDLDSLNVKTIFDYHANPQAARWGDHTASYTCPHSKDWKAWTGKNKSAMSQIEFAQFIENNIHCVASEGNVVSGTELLAMVLTFEETRKSEFKSVQRLQDGTMSFAFTDEKSGGGKTRLPEEIILGLQPFHNGDYYQIKARIRYRIKDGLLTLWYELINPEKVIEDAFNTTIENLKSNIPDVDFYEGNLA